MRSWVKTKKWVYLSAIVLCLMGMRASAYNINADDNFIERTVSPAEASDKIGDAIAVFDEIMSSKESIPRTLLYRSQGIVIIPNLVKVGTGLFGGKGGKGVIIARDFRNEWGSPAFVNLIGLSIGWHIGAQSIDTVLVFKSREGINNIIAGKFTLGVDASIAVGPVGGGAGLTFESDVYSYSQSRGLFAGLALNGSTLEIDNIANEGLYQEKVNAIDIFQGNIRNSSTAVRQLEQVLRKYTE